MRTIHTWSTPGEQGSETWYFHRDCIDIRRGRVILVQSADLFRSPATLVVGASTPQSEMVRWSLLVVVLGWCALPASGRAHESAAALRYTVFADPDLETLRVRVCFSGRPPASLGPGIARASRGLIDAHNGRGRRLRIAGGRILLRPVRHRGCVRYRVDVDRALAASRFAMRRGDDIVTNLGTWLYRPPSIPRGGATLRFALPPGLRAATPLPNRRGVHFLDATAFRRPMFMAMGRLDVQEVARHHGRVRVVRVGDGWQLDDAGVERWMSNAMDGLATVQGRFPVDRLTVILVPAPGRGIDFGMVRRGGGHSVGFIVGRDSTERDLTRSWVTWHELAHLLLPGMQQSDAWIYEGLATYYQEVLRVRMGIQTEDDMWTHLIDGFTRGARSRARAPLEELAAHMHESRAYQRVYWAGTVFSLAVDVALRRRGSSLDAMIRRGASRWRNDRRRWSGPRLCALMDSMLDGRAVSSMRDRHARRQEFPPTRRMLDALGVRRGREVTLHRAAESSIRRAIAAPGDRSSRRRANNI